MTTTNDWIRMSERRPTEADLPMWVESPEWTEPEKPRLFWNLFGVANSYSIPARSWKHAKADIPSPPKEQTQRERDEAAYRSWWDSIVPTGVERVHAWHAALAWERAEIAKMMDGIEPTQLVGNRRVYDVPGEIMEKLRARLRP